MNILIINHYAGSPELGMEFRPYYLAKEWRKMGHQVLIVGSSFSHLRKKQPIVTNECIDGIEYRWLKSKPYHGNGFGRIKSMFSFISQLYCSSKKILNGFVPDVVIASSTYPLDIFPAHKIAKRYHAKLIYEIHDLWPLSPKELGGYSSWHPFIVVMQIAENYAYKKVDAVVSILPNAKEHCVEHHLIPNKFHHVPNGVVIEDWETPESIPAEHQQVINKLKQEKKFLVAFAGAHGIANSLKSIIDAAHLLNKQQVALLLIGTGQEKNNLIKYVKDNQIDNVYFLPPVNKLAIPNLLHQMDVLFVGLQKQSLFRFGISPNKIFDYMMAKKPIVQAIDAGNNLVKEANCGIAVEPENVSAIANAISELQQMSEINRQTLGNNGYLFVNKHHTYAILAQDFINIMRL